MKNIILATLIAISGNAVAATDLCKEKCKPKQEVVKKKVHTVAKAAPVAVPCCEKQDLKSDSKAEALADAEAKATTGNQSIVINMPTKAVTKTITKVKYKTKIKTVKKTVFVYKPNRLLFLLGQSKTKLQIEEDDCKCSLSAKRKYEPDVGLQYLRDFGHFTGSIVGTTNKGYYIGLGVNW